MVLLNINQLSQLLNIKQKTIYDWVHKEKIPYCKIEGLLRFDEDEIKNWLKSKKHYPRKKLDLV